MERNCVIKFSDRNGRVMSTTTVSNAGDGASVKLNVTGYNQGVYFVTISNGKEIQNLQLSKQ